MRRWFIFLSILVGVLEAAYVPGTPGGNWTDEELIITKGKLVWIMRNPEEALSLVENGTAELNVYKTLAGAVRDRDAIIPNMPKVVRLTFHDCIPEADGQANCNGCLNFEGMGLKYSKAECSMAGTCDTINGGIHPPRGPNVTDNNNLFWVAAVLEKLYRDPNFGPVDYPQHFTESLFDSGKSRADLWAFAGLVAIQMAAETNNRFCRSKNIACRTILNGGTEHMPCAYEYPYTEFRWGRADCVPDCDGPDAPPFCTAAKEIHPNPHGNGADTVKYFRDHFNMTADETIALMGVHTLGHPNEVNSMFRHYPWTKGGTKLLNNEYFVNIVNSTNYRLVGMGKVSDNGTCLRARHIGDEWGQPWNVQFLVRSEQRTAAHGPWNWNLHGQECNYEKCKEVLAANGSYNVNSCCNLLEPCVQEGNCGAFKGCHRKDPNCELPINFFMVNMLSPDMGLYREFSVDAEGRPRGCPGLEASKNWLENKRGFFGRRSLPTECPINDTPTENGSNFSEVMERYAAGSSDVWVNDFVKVFGKMIEMGYSDANMTAAPDTWYLARRLRGGVWGVRTRRPGQ